MLVNKFQSSIYFYFDAVHSGNRTMVSRRKILSRSRDELHSDIYYMAENDDDDVWYSKEKLYAVRK